jgi:hypothetical protein
MSGSAPSSDNRRRHGRVRMQNISCGLGDVLDLSASGIRVRAKAKVPETGTRFSLKIGGLDSSFYVSCVVKWTRRVGLLAREAGLEFDELTAEQRRNLNSWLEPLRQTSISKSAVAKTKRRDATRNTRGPYHPEI